MNERIGDYVIGERLGQGGYASVYKALNLKTGEFVAVKELLLADEDQSQPVAGALPNDQRTVIMKEIGMLRQLSHPNIVRYIDYLQLPHALYIVLEFVENGSLRDVLQKFGHFPEKLGAMYVAQICSALEYLSKQSIVHRDIKAANVLITRKGVCRLADFGVAIENQTMQTLATMGANGAAGTPFWMAPEIFEGKKATSASDIWSLGVTVIELMTGNPPYYGLPMLAAVHNIMELDMPPLPEGISAALEDFLRKCFVRNPKERATASELCQHEWIREHLAAHLDTGAASGADSRHHSYEQLTSSITKANLHESKISCSQAPRQGSEQLLLGANAVIPLSLHTKLSETLSKRQEIRAQIAAIRNVDELHAKYQELEAENELLLATVTQTNASALEMQAKWTAVVQQHELFLKHKQALIDKVVMLEERFSQVHTDVELASSVYGSLELSAIFQDSTKGMLFYKKDTLLGSQWKERYCVLKDNFLFLFRMDDKEHPSDVLRLRKDRYHIRIIKDDTALHKFCFSLSIGKGKELFFCTPRQDNMEKWMQAISFVTQWYESTSLPQPGDLARSKAQPVREDKDAKKRDEKKRWRPFSSGQVTRRERTTSATRPARQLTTTVSNPDIELGASEALGLSSSPTPVPAVAPGGGGGKKRSLFSFKAHKPNQPPVQAMHGFRRHTSSSEFESRRQQQGKSTPSPVRATASPSASQGSTAVAWEYADDDDDDDDDLVDEGKLNYGDDDEDDDDDDDAASADLAAAPRPAYVDGVD